MDVAAARIARAIGEPARASMLYALMDRRARTATELAALAGVGAATASAHLKQLLENGLVKVAASGRHRYFQLATAEVARALEALGVLAGAAFAPTTPGTLRQARSCYDHIAGWLGVALHDAFIARGWLTPSYAVTAAGARGFAAQGLEAAVLPARRRFAFACLDWSERRSHLAGALGAAILDQALAKRWLRRDADSRSLEITAAGRGWLDKLGIVRP
jgi:DNA-binding transcriptional ArsR family regulator